MDCEKLRMYVVIPGAVIKKLMQRSIATNPIDKFKWNSKNPKEVREGGTEKWKTERANETKFNHVNNYIKC